MQKLIPHLWYDKEALEAAEKYVKLFDDSKIINSITLPDTPSGDAQSVEFQLAGIRFSAINGGPYFSLNPSISLMVSCGSPEEVDRLYGELSIGGADLMPLAEYPFSKRFAWLQDKYGLNWQLMLAEHQGEHQKIRPTFLFAGEACGKAEEALDYYLSVFDSSQKGHVNYYEPGQSEDQRAKINYSEFNIFGMEMIAMDHGYGGDFTFNEAFSMMILCKDQAEIDYYWEKLSFVPEAEQCGWVKDQFGISWQIVPEMLQDILAKGSKEEIKRITEAFLKMKKLDIAVLEKEL